ncbi:Aspartyl protease [Handroanthus impetiginosus]|uniref:Aspartyl protease n=1 Tax=Handroanthus impetiginosus TaxID=429701 RepID=A0A2G9H7W4_9LAMI|nr:Aspartyl protease [Handroanthus impetiginosus]
MAFSNKPLSIFLSSLILSYFAGACLISSGEASKNGGITIDLIHRDSPISPFYDTSITRFDRLRSSFYRSFSRQSFLETVHFSSKPVEAPLTPIVGEYLMKIRIGTPPVEVLAIADTGSDLTWTQCTPCPECYKQNAPLFDPRRSKTYTNISCNSQQCQELEFAFRHCDNKNVCQYDTSYGDSSISSGNLANCLISSGEASKNGDITIDLIHRDSPISPFYDTSITRFDRLRSSFYRSFSRQSFLETVHFSSKPVEAPLTPIVGEYLMKIRIGTPPVEVLAIADTGSDLTWTQCTPCPECYKQNAPLFDPRRSKTYTNISCNSQQCQELEFAFRHCDNKNVCQYDTSYGDSSISSGNLALETFTFNKNAAFPKVVFGCGQHNFGTFNKTASGIIGLGGGRLSIIRQLGKSIGGRFSYCLTTPDSKASSKISFGPNAIVVGPKILSTPLVKKSPNTFYYLTLEAISVGNKRVEHNLFSKASVQDGNIIIDSGTTLTLLPKLFYDRLESTLIKSINGRRVSDPQGLLKLCYKLPRNGKFNSPPIIAHFKGADLVLPKENTFVEVEKGVVCLTLVPSDNVPIFGNLHQVNYLMGYDLENGKLNFLPTDCSKPKRN